MLCIPDLTKPVEEVEHPFNFPLDPFQKHAISAISKDENVLVTAKTGSGKTLVGEFQIYHSLKKGKRVFYTTPIKSLSNQKFHDLKKIHKSVGIMTGDIKFCPQADIIIMTTEILRNLLFKKGEDSLLNLSMMNVDSVIFDEVHYINDSSRGKVWEECLTMIPKEINLVLLSATIEEAEKFAKWLGEIKQKPIHLISTQYRIVPLVHTLPNKQVVMDSKDIYHPNVYESWYRNYFRVQDEERKHKERVAVRDADQVVKKGEQNLSFVDRMNKLIPELELPALFFVLSRKNCAQFASKVSHDLLTSSETAEVRHIINYHLRDHKEIQQISQYHEMFALLQKGVAYHHSGILPILKEIIEILFSKGFVKVLFATETFAVGINMPTKTVVFTSYRKYDDKFRMLTTSEYIQMAGRAGRRGKDDKGVVMYLPIQDPEDPFYVKEMMTGKTASVNSQMDFGYEYVLATMNYGSNFEDKTYWINQHNEEISNLEKEIQDKHQELPKIPEFELQECEKRRYLEKLFATSVNAERRTLQGKLDSWKNKHMGKKWDDCWKEYKKLITIMDDIERLKNLILDMKDVAETCIKQRKEVLEHFGYIKDSQLTQKGLLACLIHEGHPLLMSHIFTEKVLHDNPIEDLVCYLSMFLEGGDEIEEKGDLEEIREYSKKIRDFEILESQPSYWNVTEYWFDPVYEWLSGNNGVCEKYGIDYGDFVRAMLKLSNIMEEWVSMATLTQDVEMIEKCKDIKNKIVRGFVIPDSLYLRI